jgi:hypothetical protein
MPARSGVSNRIIAASASSSSSVRSARKPSKLSSSIAVRVTDVIAVLKAAPATSSPFVVSTTGMPFYPHFLAIVSLSQREYQETPISYSGRRRTSSASKNGPFPCFDGVYGGLPKTPVPIPTGNIRLRAHQFL